MCPSVGYMVVPVCSVQTVGLYKGHGCISDVMITAALYPPLFMSVGCFCNLPPAASTVHVRHCNATKHLTPDPSRTLKNNNQFKAMGGELRWHKGAIKVELCAEQIGNKL